MKKYLLFFIICISSFIIYKDNVKAYTYNVNYTSNSNASLIVGQNYSSYNWTNLSPYTFRGWATNYNAELMGFTKGTFKMNFSGFEGNFGTYDLYFLAFADNGVNGYNESIDEFTITANGTACSTTNNVKFSTSSGISTIYCKQINVSSYTQIEITFVVQNAYSIGFSLPTLSNSTDNAMIESNFVNITNYLQSISSNLSGLNGLGSKVDETNSNLNDIKNDIKSDNTSGAESSADDLKNNSAFQDNSGLSGVISMPLTFVNSLTNTCQPIELNIPYMDVDVTIPCMQPIITEKMPLLANLIKIVVNGFIVYRILLDIFQIIRNAKNPEDDRIEVLDL